jgi:beta-fructofuranosidase
MTTAKSAVAMNFSGVRDPSVDGPQGDAIPFFHDGRYHLYYLEAPAGKFDQPERGRTPWRHIVSDDLVRWDDLRIVLPLGTRDEADPDGIWTGSVIARDGLIHIFYTGGNRPRDTPQTICHATSTDGINFTKDARNPLFGPDTAWFEAKDWRDPFVFWNEARGEYWMLLSGRVRQGPPGRRGVVVLCTSPDLEEWSVKPEPFYAPGNTYCMECPEVFELGGKWRMIFSRFSEHAATIYREADALEGPWRTPVHDALDGARWYATKSLTDDKGRRIAFGWVHDRRGFADDGEWLWGGDMCLPREIYAGDNDRLCVRLPEEIEAQFAAPRPLPLHQIAGDWQGDQASALGSFATAEIPFQVTSSELVRLTLEASFNDLRGGLGLSLFSGDGLNEGLDLFFNATTGTITLGDQVAGTEPDRRPPPYVTAWLPPRSSGELRIDLYVRGDTLEIFFDRQVALTHRIYSKVPIAPVCYIEDGVATLRASVATLGARW